MFFMAGKMKLEKKSYFCFYIGNGFLSYLAGGLAPPLKINNRKMGYCRNEYQCLPGLNCCREMSYFKERIKHAVRFRHKRGFGVHSPFMFNLILNVIRDKEKQFTYPDSIEKGNKLNSRERKVFRLLSRLIRYLRVRRVACVGYNAGLLAEYLSRVYQDATILPNLPQRLTEADFIYLGRRAEEFLGEDYNPNFKGNCRYMVIADIYKNKFNGRLWRQYSEKATVTVDMMWYGLLFFDEKIQQGRYNLII